MQLGVLGPDGETVYLPWGESNKFLSGDGSWVSLIGGEGVSLIRDPITGNITVTANGGGASMVYTINNVGADENGNFTLTASSLGAAAIDHSHVISDVAGLQDSLDDLATVDHTHPEYVSGLTVNGETAHGECSLVAGNNVVLEKSGNTISIGVDSDSYVGGIAVQNISTTSNDVVETFIGTAAQWSAFTKVAGKKYLVYII